MALDLDFTNRDPSDPNGVCALDAKNAQPAWISDDWSVVETDQAAARKKGATNPVRLATVTLNDGRQYDVIIGADGTPISPIDDTTGQDEERIAGRKYRPDGSIVSPNPDERREWHHTVRFLERLPLGTSYPDVARRLAALAASVAERSGQRPCLYVDATGVGKPVVDVLRDHKVNALLGAVYFTYGDRRIEEHSHQVTPGKAWLVSRLQALFQSERLHLPRHHPEAETMTRELLDHEIRVDKNANDTYGAFKVGSHDDLVTALGLATQLDPDGLDGALARAMDDGWASHDDGHGGTIAEPLLGDREGPPSRNGAG